MRFPTLYGGICLWLLAGVVCGDAIVLDDCEDVTLWKVTQEPARIEVAPDAAVGKGAIKVTLPGQVLRTLARSYVPDGAVWDSYEGVSFRVKGDGSAQFGCLALVGVYRYVTYFSLADTEWHKITLPWYAFVPEQPVDPIGEPGSMPPSGITGIRLGTHWKIGHNNAGIPSHSFCIDQLQLEEKVPGPGPVPSVRPFAEVLAALKAGQPVRIQCMGDSITAGTGLADRDRERYAVRTQDLLRRWLGCEAITCESRAVGGARLNDARAWVPRDFCDAPPDLVTLWYGYNDKSGAYTTDYFRRSLNDCLDRICRQTQGRSAILLFATGPGTGPRFVMMDDYAEAVRQTARERGLPCFDVNAILKALGRDHIQDYFGDMAHPNAKGHVFIADAFSQFLIDAAGITTPRPEPPPRPEVAPGEARQWSFANDNEGWQFDTGDVALTDAVVRSPAHAVHFSMVEPANDHRRAWSPMLSVKPCQKYLVRAAVRVERMSAGHMGLYVSTYPTMTATGSGNVCRIRGAETAPGQWQVLEGEFDVPEGVGAMRILVWSDRKSLGEFYLDDVALVPVP